MKHQLLDSIKFFQNVGINPALACKVEKQQMMLYLDIIVETFINKSPFSIFLFDAHKKRNIWVNDVYRERAKFPQGEILKQTPVFLDMVLHPDDFKAILHAFATQSPAGGIFRSHCRKLNMEGNWDWLYMMAMQLPASKDYPAPILGFATNLSKEGFIVDHWDKIATENARLRHKVDISLLTRREKEILSFFALGLSQKEIGYRLDISFNTVETHKRNLFKKLKRNSITGIVAFAVESGMN